MLSNYLKVTLQQMLNHKVYSFINIIGLSIGLVAFILIFLYVRHELSYDNYHQDKDRIYRVSRDFYEHVGSPEMLLATNAPNSTPLLEEDFEDIEETVRIFNNFRFLVTVRDNTFIEESIRFADGTVTDFFSFRWLQGDPGHALDEPNSVVLTESLSEKYFGTSQSMGEYLDTDLGFSLKVTGVIEDLPENTHLSFSGLGSLSTLEKNWGAGFLQQWGNNSFHSFIKLKPGTNVKNIESQLLAFSRRHIDIPIPTGMRLQALTDIHLHSTSLQFPMKTVGNFNTVMSFIVIAIGILLIACINFTNLSIARSSLKGKEIGARKALGASRADLIQRFLGESMLSAFFAMVITIAIVEIILDSFSVFVGRDLSFSVFSNGYDFLSLFGLTLLVGVIAGLYPALYLSRFAAANILRGKTGSGPVGSSLRNLLIIFQFSAAIALVIATSIIYSQMNYVKKFDLGFSKEQVLIIDNLNDNWELLKIELTGLPGIGSVTATNIPPGSNNANAFLGRYEGGDPLGRLTQYLFVDHDFFKTLEIEFLAGRDFSPDRPADRLPAMSEQQPHVSASYVISEMAARQFGWTPEQAIGKWYEFTFDEGYSVSSRGPIIGVVKDVHFEALQTLIEPVIYIFPSRRVFGSPEFNSAAIKLEGTHLTETLAHIDAAWNRVNPNAPITKRFLNQTFDELYQQDEKQRQLITYFSALAILIACMGLYGLAAFNAERRTKEIGVRKAIGGSLWSIVLLLTNDFSKLVLISNILAWPIAYFAMSRWLENFAYRIDLSPLIFIGSGLIALCIAWVTVGGTAAKAASQKPVLALRYE